MPRIYIASDKPRSGKTSVAISVATRLSQSEQKAVLIKPISIRDGSVKDDKDRDILRDANSNDSINAGDWPIMISSNIDDHVDQLDSGIKLVNEIDSSVFSIVEGLSGLTADVGKASKRIAENLNARVVVVLGYEESEIIGAAIDAKSLFGDRLCGVIINGVTRYKIREAKRVMLPKIESEGISVLALIPEDRKLLGTTVSELAEHLNGEIISWKEKGDNFVDNYLIGGMVLDWGVLYFERHLNKAVIVRGDRPDIQMAALQTDTSCLVLTGGHDPIQYVEYEAQEEEVPIIKVEGDTINTTMVLESLQKKSVFGHPIKRKQFDELIDQNGYGNLVESLMSI
ncbi:MAG: phosphotransacetylase family protein [SAR202 cluster bacterium]|nr:phosphotransacetylase family protein [SAR202 cluster bacterium]|tara:strand:- start:5750 stop:6775 length:1026 start_codon:yes stop_codon:yes gene_type:complete